jgi:hypothetical protein
MKNVIDNLSSSIIGRPIYSESSYVLLLEAYAASHIVANEG